MRTATSTVFGEDADNLGAVVRHRVLVADFEEDNPRNGHNELTRFSSGTETAHIQNGNNLSYKEGKRYKQLEEKLGHE